MSFNLLNNELPSETQIDSDGSIEHSYKLNTANGKMLYNKLASTLPKMLCLANDSSIELISIHTADSISYAENSICIVYGKLANDRLIEKFSLNKSRLIDFYACKIGLASGSLTYKFYYKYTPIIEQFYFEKLKSLKNFWLAKEFGISYYPSMKNIYDIYFYTTDIARVYSLLGFIEPEESKKWHNVENAHYAITVKDNRVIKLKRYVHPLTDPKLSRWYEIDGLESIKVFY